jgi:ketosteroid isomerase-like protein
MKSTIAGLQTLGTKDTTQRALIHETNNKNQRRKDREMASTKNVIEHHLKCFGEGDLKGILSDYAPGAVLFTPSGPLRGDDAIRPLFQGMIAEFGKPGAAFKMEQQFIEADYAYIVWTAETADNVYELGTDTFVVRDGKIVAQSFTSKMTPKG